MANFIWKHLKDRKIIKKKNKIFTQNKKIKKIKKNER
jgi:hypothetical protein